MQRDTILVSNRHNSHMVQKFTGPDAIWNLTGLCGYFMEEFLENLLKDCVQFAGEMSIAENSIDSSNASK